MRTVLTIFLITFLARAFGQTPQLDKIENEIRRIAMQGKFDKQVVDLNTDGTDDIIYLFQCGEPKCIQVYLNINGLYKEQINEQCNSYTLWNIENKKVLKLHLVQCCGDNAYFSNRTFEFNQTSANLTENYVLTDKQYAGQTNLLTPLAYSANPLVVQVTIDNLNLRFSPSLQKLTVKAKEPSFFICENGTNIIAKIKKGSKIKVLSELIETGRTWLFVEADNSMLTKTPNCNPISFNFKDQKLRGWVSNKYVERQ